MQAVLDIVGIGFGPSNLALAAAIHEQQKTKLSTLFLEQQETFSWHKGMLLNDTEMQISFLKDIATLRNPSSPFSFLNYLHEQGRLAAFINLKNFHPSRIEFHDYFCWAARKLEQYVKYGCRVIDIIPYGNKPYSLLKIVFQNQLKGTTEFVLAKNIVVAIGGTPSTPSFIEKKSNSENIWHTSEYLKKIQKFKKDSSYPYHFCVVGGGQSAAEIVYDLAVNFPAAKVTCVYRGFGYKPADESQFSNEVFNSEVVDLFYSSSSELKDTVLKQHADTNYSVVDIELIQKIYKMQYEDTILKNQRLEFMRLSSLINAVEKNNKAEVMIKSTISSEKIRNLSVDGLILATGYHYPNPPIVLSSLSEYFKFECSNVPKVTRCYQIETHSDLQAKIYTQGCNEKTHGLSDTLLSLSSIRAKEILDDLMKKTPATIKVDANQEVVYG